MMKLYNLKRLAAFMLVSISFYAIGSVKKSDCLHKRNTICHGIIKLNPTMNHKDAYKLSGIFYKTAKKYNLDRNLLISIAYQESTFNPRAIRKVSGLVFDSFDNEYKKMRVGSDFCMMQIHISNINKMNLDVEKLLSKPSYCIEAGAKILSMYQKKFSAKQKTWWTLYNAKTKAKRAIYFNKVTRHLNILNQKTAQKSNENRKIASKI